MRVHRAMSRGLPSVRGGILAGAWLGVLTHVITPGLVDEAAREGRAREARLRLLPARVTAYFVLGLCLFSGLSYPGVFAQVTAGPGLASPASTALTAARRRLGAKPLESLFRRLCSPLSPGTAPWSHVAGLLAVAWDGTGITVADTPANQAAFGCPRKGAAPQARLVTLIACGTRALLGAAAGPWRGAGTGERALARQLLGLLRPGMLLLADRGFYSWGLWNAAAATGAHLLWRITAPMKLPPARELPDGSWLAHIDDPAAVRARDKKNSHRRTRGSTLPPDTSPLPGITVRVIEYAAAVTADDGTRRTSRYRLLTTLLDHRAFPAAMLADAYTRRWAAETGYRDCKTSLRGPGRALRGRTPDLAMQEIWALLAVCQALRVLIARAAAAAGLDPARLSFTAALDAARATMHAPRARLPAALAETEARILAAPVPERPGRIYPRAVKRKPWTSFPVRKRAQDPVSHHATCTVTITRPRSPAQSGSNQRKQPPATANPPP